MAPKAKAQDSSSRIPVEQTDDERTSVSKTITWILRRGAKKVNINIDDNGWVKIADLLKYEDLNQLDEPKLMQVINDSNLKKARYEVSPDHKQVRAYQKKERETLNTQMLNTPAAAPAAAPTTPYSQAAASQAATMAAMQYMWPGYGYPSVPSMNPWTMYMGWQQAAAMPAAMTAQAATGRYQGRIKSFNSDKGFGFIECYETYSLYNRDVFLHKAQINDMNVGQMVTFTCEVNKQGMPQAKEVAPIGGVVGGTTAQAGGKSKGKGKDKGDAKGKGKGKDKGEKGEGKGEKGEGKGKKKDKKGEKAEKGEKTEKAEKAEKGEKKKKAKETEEKKEGAEAAPAAPAAEA